MTTYFFWGFYCTRLFTKCGLYIGIYTVASNRKRFLIKSLILNNMCWLPSEIITSCWHILFIKNIFFSQRCQSATETHSHKLCVICIIRCRSYCMMFGACIACYGAIYICVYTYFVFTCSTYSIPTLYTIFCYLRFWFNKMFFVYC